mmetsp:Transcript_32943/g.55157  ORF Transcript_32943/g.55157 Transcript_32943/m.55157 type:complete len:154 (+) Transcript_32943:133-594(+)|eukprot:CAMPEP_0198228678 /NCGR_PEP_ID=MMETSP1445-20131203/113724_1 /TAXON_ID=36898 /ORGANISM="Pyramimonas sp., Strain CCMP2087" /LENGTH=153 /DNA_ID=CAMNT_0043909095 /DNA_START=113 /DNA_END=574 /DNA_ORIENTATION=-
MSKLVDQKMRERQDKLHKRRIQSMKPSVDNKPPPQFQHLQLNLKKAQQEEDRLTEVEKQNGILLDKLSRIASRPDPGSSKKALVPGEAPKNQDRQLTLNAPQRKAELQRIAEENQTLLKRIQEKQVLPSQYNKDKYDKEFLQHEEYVKIGRQT